LVVGSFGQKSESLAEKYKRVQLFQQLAEFKFILCLKSLWDFVGQELCYFFHCPKRRFPEDRDVHPVNEKQDSLSTTTSRTQH